MFKYLADLITYQLLNLPKESHLAESLNFFLYDVPKIYVLLVSVVFVVSVLRTFLPPEKIRQILSHKMEFVGNILASCFGIFIPFCTCSAIPLFIGMLESGVPLGVTMSFLVASPMINEIALVLLWGLFGWKVAVTYIVSGLVIATLSGFIIGRLKMEKYLETLVAKPKTCGCGCKDEYGDQQSSCGPKPAVSSLPLAGGARFQYAYEYTLEVFKSIWLYIILGVGVGALIHGYVPVELVTKYAGPGNPFAVIIAVLLGIPIYANCAGAIPVVQAILEKGLPLGTSLAFMMAVTGLSLPEFLILRKVMKLRLLLTFFGIVGLGIIITGYLFNVLF
ncbi:MAG: permease [Candidatus Margulisiibacteriota bacterium]